MTKQTATYTVEPFPAARQLIAEAGRMGARRSMIHGLLEIDVTHARTVLREHKAQTGETLSFTAFIVACLAQAIDQDRERRRYGIAVFLKVHGHLVAVERHSIP